MIITTLNIQCYIRLGIVVTKKRKKKHFVLNMPFVFSLICGIVLVRKKLPEIGKVARHRKSCQKVAEHLVDSVKRCGQACITCGLTTSQNDVLEIVSAIGRRFHFLAI